MKLLLVPYLAAHLAVGAPTKVEIHIMPPGSPVVVDGVRYQGFTFDEYKLLLQMDNELDAARDEINLNVDLKLVLKGVIEEKDRVISTLQKDVETYRGRGDRLDGKLKTCEKDLVAASGGSSIPWIIAGVGAALGILGIGFGYGSQSSK